MAKKIAKKAVKRITKKAAVKTGGKSGASSSGRPKGSGRYGCPTKAVRVPIQLEEAVVNFILKQLKKS